MSVARAAAQGAAWTMGFGISARLVTLTATLVLTRFVAPEEYGAVLAASICVTTAGVLTSFAIGQYLIARDAPPEVACQAAALHFVLGVIAVIVLFVFRAPLGELLDTPGMARFVIWYAVAHLIDRARYVPERLLMRDLRFRVIARINGVGELVFAAVAVGLAWRWGSLAIVIGVLMRAVVTAQLFFVAVPRSEWLVVAPLRPDLVRGLIRYGGPILIGAVADRAATRWDSLIVSKLFGPALMAQYNLAYSLAEMPVSHVADSIGEVLMPSFTRLDERRRRSAAVRAAALMALIVCPLGVGLGAVAPTLVAAFFDERWHGMAPLLAILSIMTVFQPMTRVPIHYLQAVQQTSPIMFVSVSRALIVLPLVAVLGYVGGPAWACLGGGVGYALHGIGTIVAVDKFAGLPVASHLIGVLRPLLACAPMFAVVRAMGSWADATGLPPVALLVMQIVIGGAIYAALAFVFVRPTALELVRLVKEVFSPGRVGASTTSADPRA